MPTETMYRLNAPRHPEPGPRAAMPVMLLLLFLGALAGTGCNRTEAAATGKGKKDGVANLPPRAVKTVKVAQVPMERKVTVIGMLAAEEQSTLSAKVAGRLDIVAMDLGTPVKKGQLIAQIERRDYELRVKQVEAQLAQARANLGLVIGGTNDYVVVENTSLVKQAKAVKEEAAKNLERVTKLTEKGIVPQSDLETAQASHEVAVNKYETAIEEVHNRQGMALQRRAELEIARQQLTDTEIKTPFEGIVQERKANLGEYLIIGTPVATIVRNDPLRLRVEVPEREAPGIRAGLLVRLVTEGQTNTYSGEIKRLSPSINDLSRMLIVEADVRNDGSLRPGTFAKADIVVEDKNMTVAIPNDALITFAGLEKAVVVVNGKAVERLVSVGRRVGGFVEITAGLKVGETVVLSPGNLQSGQAVTMAK